MIHPLTPLQQGMLFHHWRAGRHSGADVEQLIVDLDEALDPPRLHAAWHAVVQRHGALRTRIEGPDPAQAVQVVEASIELPFTVDDWRALPPPAQAERWAQHLADDRRAGFDLARAPLTRVHLVRLGDAHWRMLWTVHHIVCDGRSFPVVLSEVLTRLDGHTSPDTAPAPDFGALCAQRAAQTGDAAFRVGAEAFWRERLQGLAAQPLPGREADVSVERAQVELNLGEATQAALQALADRAGASLGTVVAGAWGLTLAQLTGEDDVIFGSLRAQRRDGDARLDDLVGCLVNTLPVRVAVDGSAPVADWLGRLHQREREAGRWAGIDLMSVQAWSGVMGRHAERGLFDSVLVYDHHPLDAQMRRAPWATAPEAHARRRFELQEQTHYPLTLYAWGAAPLPLRLAYDPHRFSAAMAQRIAGGLVRMLQGMAADPQAPLRTLSALTPDDEARLDAWNATQAPPPSATGIAREFEAQVRRTPQALAVVHGDTSLSYEALNRRANRLAHHLMGLGVGPDVPVAVLLSRGTDLVVALLAVLKAGGAYLPLDPSYPRERLAWKFADAGARVLLTQAEHGALLDAGDTPCVFIDDERRLARHPEHDPATAGDASRLAYVIYTSGSTGRPKGVLVEQRQVLAFFSAMDSRLPRRPAAEGQDAWLAVTSVAFDISVLELLWTLTRGVKLVIQGEALGGRAVSAPRPHQDRPIAFSLMYFASAASAGREPYRLLIEGARFADAHGFQAVWTPERHFHDFGGLYPNPALASAMLAAVTTRVQLRAGSVVAALHHPARIAEEWAVADQLSGGRVGVSFASGWQPRDFVLAPQAYEGARSRMLETVDRVRRLWRGEALTMPGPQGKTFEVRTLPRPSRAELPVWLTAAGAPQTFEDAGRVGAGVLTHLLGQTLDEVAGKIARYREAWRAAGHPGQGHVTMMLHSFVGDDTDTVRETVRRPMMDYLGASLSLVKGYASAWSAFKKGAANADAGEVDLDTLPEDERQGLLAYAFERYFETSGLFGDTSRALDMVDRLKGIGVDEVACLIDFGVDEDTTLAHLQHLARVHRLAQPAAEPTQPLPEAMAQHDITHLQCTPSLASALVLDDAFLSRLPRLQALMLGGEALPPALAGRLLDAGLPRLLNLYGPTETTIWSAVHEVRPEDAAADSVPIGQPLANTRLHVVDRHGRRLPPGLSGELCIGGAGVVRGYHARAELTAERFVPEPWAGPRAGEARMYRTGDLVRRREDGALEFLGRLDHQVKIRGHRIELGEIEAALAAAPGVREAVVVAREDAPGEARLVAYVVPTDPAEGDATRQERLRGLLRQQLPEAMVPALVLSLERLPLTANLKIDRRALPAPQDLHPAPDAGATGAGAAPFHAGSGPAAAGSASPLEARVAALWQEVLSLPQVGLDQNFFDLGGHSLLAVKAHRRLLAELPEAAEAGLAITDLFRHPTVRALARRLAATAASAALPAAAVQTSVDRAAQRRAALASRRQPGR